MPLWRVECGCTRENCTVGGEAGGQRSPVNAKGPRPKPGPFVQIRNYSEMRVYLLSAPYWKMPIVASVGSPFSSNVIGPELPS